MAIPIFIDTNIFLSFYSFSQDDLEELKKLPEAIKNGHVLLFLPTQVEREFRRNRETRLAQAIDLLNSLNAGGNFPLPAQHYNEYKLALAAKQEYEAQIDTLKKKFTEEIKGHSLIADQLLEDIFKQSTNIDITKDIIDAARERVEIGEPPGKPGNIRDAINWEALLATKDACGTEDLPFFLLSSDNDYESAVHKGQIKHVLELEWADHGKQSIQLCKRLGEFFKINFPDIRIAGEMKKKSQIDQLEYSGSFSTTHHAVSKLSENLDFTDNEVKRLIQIAINNNQVGWIIDDSDINDFYKSLLVGKFHILNKEEQDWFQDNLTQIDLDAEIPF